MSLKLLYVCVVVLCVDGHKNHDKQTAPPSALAASPVSSSVSGSFQGSWMETRRGRRIQAYRGIRYAEPPTGKLRFQPPKPILQYKEPVNATTDGPACPSPTRPGYYVDEDCLSVNVYTPENNGSSMTPLPVIVYFHPGGFYSMNGRSDLAGPGYLLDKDLVLVTVNYRLGPLGFMSTGDAVAPGNNGMKDQVAALRWVQRNIRAFGGDPLGVTIAGCSAGSISVMLHMVSPMSRGLFHRAISMSGSPFGKTLMSSELNKLAIRQAEILNCPSNSSQEIMDCLMTKDWKEIVGTLSQFYVSILGLLHDKTLHEDKACGKTGETFFGMQADELTGHLLGRSYRHSWISAMSGDHQLQDIFKDFLQVLFGEVQVIALEKHRRGQRF